MFKKLLTLAAVAAVCTSMNAKVVQDMYVDWTANTWTGYVMGYIPQTSAEEGLIFEWPNFKYEKVEDDGVNPNGYEIVKINGEDNYVVPTDGPMESWGIQAHLLKENCPTEPGTIYSVTICAKSSKDGATLGLPFSWGWGSGEGVNGSVQIGTDWDEYTCDYTGEVGGASCWLVGQMYSGDNDARICVKWVKITHEESDGPVVETQWDEHLVNGDAEGTYGEVPCAYSKEYKGRNMADLDADGNPKEIAQPEPSEIITVDGSKVFVCRAKTVDPNEFPDFFMDKDGNVKGDPQWQNQFWIQSPQEWKEGQQFRLSFRYKADKAASADTQCHGEKPGNYLHWNAIGGINFTTEWQEFSRTVTVDASMKGMWSVAFNLKDYTMDNNYYFDDLKWETMVLDEGWFAAAGTTATNMDVNSAIEFEEEDDNYVVIVGDKENPVEYVKISTVRGEKTAFNSNTIFVETVVDDEEEFADFEKKAGKAIQLPYAGQWKIIIDEEYGQIAFACLYKVSGIEGVSVENVAPVYYNLQGVKVLNPANGNIYIVKRGNKVSKEIVR